MSGSIEPADHLIADFGLDKRATRLGDFRELPEDLPSAESVMNEVAEAIRAEAVPFFDRSGGLATFAIAAEVHANGRVNWPTALRRSRRQPGVTRPRRSRCWPGRHRGAGPSCACPAVSDGVGAQVIESDGMKPNRSIPAATVIPVLTYPDVREAVEWLAAAFGFEERVRIGENHRAQMRFGDGALIVADVRNERRQPEADVVTHSVMVRVEDARGHRERAGAHGARILMEPTDFEYGERQYEAVDLAGHHWTFSETLADVAPEQWGGESAG
ncbi:hypothetical protein GCM10010112_23400 [Actinoplanes lobatus]|uniref:Putative glyoxalase superfamily protein PhnB n=1 Tax=Actinoplanes lobatus TaxID=113568 RepID=A0A7W7MIB5_9ACTN|nr:VOC family protein [Actinoplanes lobatus]MBB4751382.1 putative glyoxalase superfamily protein PhnB [Actinoplanes lobatus]GGN63800.1 hypothetical protein GCM10010112_23400 [Actinoplanes lobatus]GIE40991.1 hypothetical protein Alo02nite_38890 [Actinoplanes lobatus]